MSEFNLKDYESIRTELRQFKQNQTTIISILITASLTAYAYGAKYPYILPSMTGFVIPAMFAALGTLWIDQVYRQCEIAFYSFLLECKIVLGYQEKGWQHFVYNKRSASRTIELNIFRGKFTSALKKHKMKDYLVDMLRKVYNSASLYYYAVYTISFLGIPLLSWIYSVFQANKLGKGNHSQIYRLGIFIWLAFLFLVVLYILNILALQNELKKAAIKENNDEEIEVSANLGNNKDFDSCEYVREAERIIEDHKMEQQQK